jgi:hypothetical protein
VGVGAGAGAGCMRYHALARRCALSGCAVCGVLCAVCTKTLEALVSCYCALFLDSRLCLDLRFACASINQQSKIKIYMCGLDTRRKEKERKKEK